jgi:transcriptional regulator with XRE-family HTH domain/predicted transcriptional regulator
MVDPRVFGQQLRHRRRSRGLTLGALGELVGRPASYLSQLENGRREPRLSTVVQLASALGCEPAALLDQAPPNRRAELEVLVAQMQEDPRYQALRLPYLRPSAKLDDTALEHMVALFGRVRELTPPVRPAGPAPGAAGIGARGANAAMRGEMRKRDNYFEEIERIAGEALAAVGYEGRGAIPERTLTDLAAHFGYRIARVQDLPPSTRSVTDQERRIIYVPQRNGVTVRTARSVVAQTLGHFALGHRQPADFDGYVRQRVEANYFSGALLAPEGAVVRMLQDAKARADISIEDLNEVFYISYETAAHRVTNLITRHLDIPVHFQRSDPDGLLWKAYENDGVLLPADADGTIEGQRVCRWWSARQAFDSEDSFAMYYQYTDTVAGEYWCATHVEVEGGRGDAVTFGTTGEFARWFRGSDTQRRARSRCPDPSCCSEPPPDQVERWATTVWPSARDHSQFVSGLPTDTVTFDPYPGVDFSDVYSFLDRHSS